MASLRVEGLGLGESLWSQSLSKLCDARFERAYLTILNILSEFISV